MTLQLQAGIPPNPGTGVQDTQHSLAFKGSRFVGALPPATDTALPAGGDDGGGAQVGAWPTFTVPDYEEYAVAFWDPADTSNGGTYHVYWTALYPMLPTSSQPLAGAQDVTAARQLGVFYMAGGLRRRCYVTLNCQTAPTGGNVDNAGAFAQATIAGNLLIVAEVKLESYQTMGMLLELSFEVDPHAEYQVTADTFNNGTVSVFKWIEVDG